MRNPNLDEGLETSEGVENKDASYAGWDVVDDQGGGEFELLDIRRAFKIEKHVGCDPWPEEAGLVYHNVVTTDFRGTRCQKIQLQNKVPTIVQQLNGGRKIQVHWSVWIAPCFDRPLRFFASVSWAGGEIELGSMGGMVWRSGGKWIKFRKVVTLDGCLDGEFVYKDSGYDSRFRNGYYQVKILSPKITIKIV